MVTLNFVVIPSLDHDIVSKGALGSYTKSNVKQLLRLVHKRRKYQRTYIRKQFQEMENLPLILTSIKNYFIQKKIKTLFVIYN